MTSTPSTRAAYVFARAHTHTSFQLGHKHNAQTHNVLHLSDSHRKARLHVGKHRVVDGANRRRALRVLATRCRIMLNAIVCNRLVLTRAVV